MDTRKRPSGSLVVNGAVKKTKSEIDSGKGSKSKPCTKYFSTVGCPFGENCLFLHNVPGGYSAVAHMMKLEPAPLSKNAASFAVPNGGSAPIVKSKMCNKFNTAEGCKFGDKCHFAHGEWELGKSVIPDPVHEDPRTMGQIPNRFGARLEQSGTASSFGASATAKVSIDASLAGAIIGKGGIHSKQICRETGVKLSIREHESDQNLKNVELEGSFEQIQLASAMVRDLIGRLNSVAAPTKASALQQGPPPPHGPMSKSNYKTKLCENFDSGSCTFGERCHFAHGAAELRKSGV